MSPITAEQLEHFQQRGYVVLREYLSGAEVAEMLSEVHRFIDDVIPTLASEEAFYEDKSRPETLKQIHRMCEYDSFFTQQMTGPRFLPLAQALLQADVVVKNMQYFNKPPLVGEPTPPHQDGYYFMLEPNEALTMWLALEQVDEENGCVRYIPGSHLTGMRPHGKSGTLGFSQGIQDYTEEDIQREEPIPAEPGDLIIHHAMTVHRANGNHSEFRHRRAMGMVYYSAEATVARDKVTAYQQSLVEELTAEGKI